MSKQLKADLMMVIATMFWGISYVLVNYSLTEVPTFTLNAIRFLIAFGVAGVIFWPRLRGVNRQTMKYSAIVGCVLGMVYVLCTLGVQYTSISNAGFLCAMAVVITPILGFFFKKQKPSPRLAITACMAVAGIALLTMSGEVRFAIGDLLCILSAAAYAVDLLVTESAVSKPEVNAMQMGVFQLLFTGLFNLILGLFFEKPALPHSAGVWGAVLALAVLCTGVTFIVQTVAQQYTSAAHVGVIFALEPVFAGIMAFFVVGEVLTPKGYLGGVLLVSSLFVMELGGKKKRMAAAAEAEAPIVAELMPDPEE